MHIGEKIDFLINSSPNYSKIGLSNHLGKTRQVIYDIIKNPDINTRILRDIAAYFQVPLINFFTEDNSSLLMDKSSIGNLKEMEERLTTLEMKVFKLEHSHKDVLP